MSDQDIAKQNRALKKVSKSLFGDQAELRVVRPASLQLLKQNARFFKKDQFKQLIANLEQDQRLSSMPLCHILAGDILEVLSGNHRVKAAIQAKLEFIIVMVILGDLSKSDQLAMQLSHNALVGQDDEQILADLWSRIDDIKARVYAGLSSDVLGELKKVKLISFSTPQIRTRRVAFVFTEIEEDAIGAVLEELATVPADTIHLANLEQFDAFFALLIKTKKIKDIKNSSLAMLRLVELAGVALTQQEVA